MLCKQLLETSSLQKSFSLAKLVEQCVFLAKKALSRRMLWKPSVVRLAPESFVLRYEGSVWVANDMSDDVCRFGNRFSGLAICFQQRLTFKTLAGPIANRRLQSRRPLSTLTASTLGSRSSSCSWLTMQPSNWRLLDNREESPQTKKAKFSALVNKVGDYSKKLGCPMELRGLLPAVRLASSVCSLVECAQLSSQAQIFSVPLLVPSTNSL